jgi:cytidylate kinase
MQGKIIGISGTNGSGKDTLGHILGTQHGFLFISVTDVLREELRKRGAPVDREHLRALSAEWRHEYGLGVLVDRAVDLFHKSNTAPQSYEGVAIASLRNPYEVDRVHELGGVVWWLDADPHLRYERIQRAAAERGRAGEDQKSFEEFLAEEEAEMHGTADAASLDMSAVRDKSDLSLQNAGSDMAAFAAEVAEVLRNPD